MLPKLSNVRLQKLTQKMRILKHIYTQQPKNMSLYDAPNNKNMFTSLGQEFLLVVKRSGEFVVVANQAIYIFVSLLDVEEKNVIVRCLPFRL